LSDIRVNYFKEMEREQGKGRGSRDESVENEYKK
jgi:hypothetical protein